MATPDFPDFANRSVLYEMLTGKRAAQERVPVEPPAIESIVGTCMEQDPEDRWQSARDLRRALSLPPTEPPAKRNPWRERAAWMAAAVLALALIAMLFAMRPPASADAEFARFNIFPPQHTDFTGPNNLVTVPVPQFALSHDGKFLAFIAGSAGAKPSLWLRALSSVEAHPLPETEGAEYPFWSPDDRWIGFFGAGKLKKVPVTGGPSQNVADVVDSRGGWWSTDDSIFYSQGTTGVFRVSSAGGHATEVTKPDASRGEGSHRFSNVLPNGSHFLYTMRSSLPEQRGVYVGSLDGKLKKLLVRGAAGATRVGPLSTTTKGGYTMNAQCCSLRCRKTLNMRNSRPNRRYRKSFRIKKGH